MDIKDLEPIITLMNQQEERLVKKINDVHTDVILTKAQATNTNGKVAEQEKKIFILQQEAMIRQATCAANFAGLKPTIPTVKILNYIGNKPKLVLFVFVTTVIGIQALVTEAIQNNWLAELVKFIKP